jgi:hypothetical protein
MQKFKLDLSTKVLKKRFSVLVEDKFVLGRRFQVIKLNGNFAKIAFVNYYQMLTRKNLSFFLKLLRKKFMEASLPLSRGISLSGIGYKFFTPRRFKYQKFIFEMWFCSSTVRL